MIIGDTGPLVAAQDRADPLHDTAVAAMVGLQVPIVVPGPVVWEVCCFLSRQVGPEAEAAFLDRIGMGTVRVEWPTAVDFTRAAGLVRAYADFPLGAVDALVCAIAERLGVRRLLTFDRRHFAAVKPAHCEAFELLP